MPSVSCQLSFPLQRFTKSTESTQSRFIPGSGVNFVVYFLEFAVLTLVEKQTWDPVSFLGNCNFPSPEENGWGGGGQSSMKDRSLGRSSLPVLKGCWDPWYARFMPPDLTKFRERCNFFLGDHFS